MTEIVCFLCGSKAESAQRLAPSGAPVGGWLAVRCPSCRGYLIQSKAAEPGAIPPGVAEQLAQRARDDYKEDGSSMLEVTEALILWLKMQGKGGVDRPR